jgi:hypothetical protein
MWGISMAHEVGPANAGTGEAGFKLIDEPISSGLDII